eukprot:16255240-Heterocapsa_arctica.AAC.1
MAAWPWWRRSDRWQAAGLPLSVRWPEIRGCAERPGRHLQCAGSEVRWPEVRGSPNVLDAISKGPAAKLAAE